MTRKRVAVKVLHERFAVQSSIRARFLPRGARAACQILHPHVVQVHDVLELPDGAPAMVMDFLHGESLAAKLEREGPHDVSDLVMQMLQRDRSVRPELREVLELLRRHTRTTTSFRIIATQPDSRPRRRARRASLTQNATMPRRNITSSIGRHRHSRQATPPAAALERRRAIPIDARVKTHAAAATI